MKIEFATSNYEKQINIFFEKYLDKKNEAITGTEFFCPFGVIAAIKKNQVIIVLNDQKIIAAMRFYPRKRDNIISLYQFAIDVNYRGGGLLKKMLLKTGYKNFEVLCPIKSMFNEYYRKTNWTLKSNDEKINCWGLYLE